MKDLGFNTEKFLNSKAQVFRKIVKEIAPYELGELNLRLKGKEDILKGTIAEDENSQSMMSKPKLSMPPSLQCHLCKGLIKKACMTRCCGTFSACQKCLQQYLVANKF